MRDQRLDFWRGLCLVDMILVHLAWEHVDFGRFGTDLVLHYTRFAAGGFVFMAGFGVGHLFLPKAIGDWQARRTVYNRLWQRAAVLLMVHYIAALSFCAMQVERGVSIGTATGLPLMWQIVTWQRMPEYGDILPLYVVLLAVVPLVNELRRWAGWTSVVLLSVGLMVLGQQHPGLLSPNEAASFPPLLWQIFFFVGAACGWLEPRYRRLVVSQKTMLTGLAGTAFALLFVAANGPALGWIQEAPFGLVFRKDPLSGGETAWYFAIFVVILMGTDLGWTWLRSSQPVQAIVRLGRQSLSVYIAHVFAQTVVLEIIWRYQAAPVQQMALVLLDLVALWALAWVQDQRAVIETRALRPAWNHVRRSVQFAPFAVAAFAGVVLWHAPQTGSLGPADDEISVAQLIDAEPAISPTDPETTQIEVSGEPDNGDQASDSWLGNPPMPLDVSDNDSPDTQSL